jgi:hypothetical protein
MKLILANDRLANAESIRGVYASTLSGDPEEVTACGRSDHALVAIDYESGLVVTYDLVQGTGCPFDADPVDVYKSELTDNPDATVGDVNGFPAMFFPSDSSGDASVSFVAGGVKIDLYAAYAPLDLTDLERVAASMS